MNLLKKFSKTYNSKVGAEEIDLMAIKAFFKNLICRFVGSFLSKFINKIDYSRGEVCLFFRDDLFANNQVPFNIKQIRIGLMSYILGFGAALLTHLSDYITSNKPEPSKILGLIKFLLIPLFAVFQIIFLLLYTFLNIVLDKFFPTIKQKLIHSLNSIVKEQGLILSSITFDIEIPINDQQEQINLIVSLQSIYFSINNITNFDFYLELKCVEIELSNASKNKTIIKMDSSEFQFKLYKNNNIMNLIFESFSGLSIYFSPSNIDSIISLVNQFRTLNIGKSNNNSKKLNELDLILNINISTLKFYIIKSNFPILLLYIEPCPIQYPFNQENSETKIEVQFELIHLCHNSYNVIDNFSSIISINESEINVIVSPIYLSLSSFLFKELSEPELDDHFHSQLENQFQYIYFQNDTEMEIDLTLITKPKKGYMFFKLYDNEPYKFSKNKYEQNIEILFNEKNYYFSIDSLYSPIYLDEDMIISLKTENGISMVHFTSPYVFQNLLSYDIEVHFACKKFIRINSGKDKYAPCAIGFNLSECMLVSRVDQFEKQILEFKSPEPVELIDEKFLIDSKPASFYATCFLSFESQKTICSINFFPYISIKNFLPHDIKLIIKNITEIELKQNVINDISFLKDRKEELIFNFEQFGMSGKITIKNKLDNFNDEITLYKNGKQVGQIAIQCSEIKVENKKFYVMKIYCPLILENQTYIPLTLQVSQNLDYSFINNFIFFSSKSLMNHESCSVKLPISYSKLTNVNSNDYKIVGNFSQVVSLQHKKNNLLSFLLLLKKRENTCDDSLNIPTSYITISPYLKVHSEVNETVIFAANEYQNKCYKGDNIILGSNERGLFDIYVEGYQKCKEFDIFELGSTIIRLEKPSGEEPILLYKIVVKKEDSGYCCYISYPSLSSDLSIKNEIDECINVQQVMDPDIENFVCHPFIIPPKKELIYAKEQPFISKESTFNNFCRISFGNNTNDYMISCINLCQSKRFDNTNYFYDVKKIGKEKRTIVIYEKSDIDDDDQTNNNNSVKLPKISFSLVLTEVQASLIDKEMHELFLIAAKNISFRTKNIVTFSIEGFTINDMYSASFSPVVLNGKEAPFLLLEIETYAPLKSLLFEDVSIKIAPIQAFIDFQFVGDFIAMMKEISNCFIQFKLNNDFLSKNIYMKKFSIKDIIVCLTPSCLLNRKYRFKHNDDFYFSFYKIPFSKVISIDLQEINKIGVYAPLINFLKSIPYSYLNQITFKKGLIFLEKFIFQVPNESKMFSDFLLYKDQLCNDKVLEIPRRIPRAFPNGKIYSIPGCLTDKYPDEPTVIQYALQKTNPFKYGNEQLKELFFESDTKNCLAIFNNILYIYNKDKSIIIDYSDIKSIEYDSYSLSIKYSKGTVNFSCQDEDDVHSIANKFNFFMQKIKISKEYYS